jgi:hypothetical protein
MSEEKKPKEVIDFSSLGGRQVIGPSAPNEPSKPIDFSDIGGRCIYQPLESPEESEEEAASGDH